MEIYDVFISYRRSDGEEYAKELYKELTNKGLRVFFDSKKMEHGKDFPSQLKCNVKNTPNYILIATPDVFKFRDGEDWVRTEIEIALERYYENEEECNFIILLPDSYTLPNEKDLPESIKRIVNIDYSGDLFGNFDALLKIITKANRRNIWYAAHRWLETSKKPGGRFAGINIVEGILPGVLANEQKSHEMAVTVSDKANEKKSLIDAVCGTDRHIYLIGQGGIGKTTALMHIMNSSYEDKMYSSNTQIPIFIELSFAPDTYGELYRNGKSSFIRRSVYKQLRSDRSIKQFSFSDVNDIDEVFSTLSYEIAVKPIMDIFMPGTKPVPEYLLLLDGLNEVSSVTVEETGLTVAQMIMAEINMIMSECPNVRVVLTGRSDEDGINSSSIERLKLIGKDENDIMEYLEKAGFSQKKRDRIAKDKSLLKTLEIPLFLTMYATLSESEGITTQGEILKTFFNERRDNISVYTIQKRLATVEDNVSKAASAVQKKRINADMQNFILDFILPEIARKMEMRGEFYLSLREIKKIIEPILTDTSDTAICGEFGREIFLKFRKGQTAKNHTYKVAKDIIQRMGEDITEVSEDIVRCSVSCLGILQETNGKYGFIHQHIRDYFTSVSIVNTMRLSVYLYEEGEKDKALECMDKVFKDEPISTVVRKFTGEYLGEHKNTPYYDKGKYNSVIKSNESDSSLIERALDIYRDTFEKNHGFNLYSLLKILQDTRKALAGINLSRLDLTKCSLNETELGIYGLSALLDGSKVNADSLFPTGHKDRISGLCFSEDGSELISTDEEGKIKIWETKTGNLIKTFEHNGSLLGVCFREDEIITVNSSENYICRFSLKTGEMVQMEKIPYTESVRFTDDKEYVMLLSTEKIEIRRIRDFSVATVFSPHKDQSIIDASFALNNSCLALLIEKEDQWDIEKKLVLWDTTSAAERGSKIVGEDTKEISCFKENTLITIERDAGEGIIKGRMYNSDFKELGVAEFDSEFLFIFKSLVKYNRAGAQFLVGFNNKLNIYSSESFILINSILLDGIINEAAFDESGKILAVGTQTGEISIYNTDSFSPVATIKESPTKTDYFTFTPDNKYIVTYSRDKSLRIFDSETLVLKGQKRIPFSSPVETIELSPDGSMLNIPNHICLSGMDYIEGLLGIPALQSLNKDAIKGTAVFNGDSTLYALRQTAKADGYTVYDAKTHQPLGNLENMRVVSFFGNKAVATVDDQDLKHIVTADIDTGHISNRLYIEKEAVNDISVYKNFISAISKKGTLCIWEGENPKLIKKVNSSLSPEDGACAIKFSPDGRFLVEHNYKEIAVRETNNFEVIFTVRGSFLQITSEYITASVNNGNGCTTVKIYSLSTFKEVYSYDFFGIGNITNRVNISPDNKRLIMQGIDDSVGLFGITKDDKDGTIHLEYLGKIIGRYGLEYIGVDFKSLHTDRPLTEKEIEILRQYGAII